MRLAPLSTRCRHRQQPRSILALYLQAHHRRTKQILCRRPHLTVPGYGFPTDQRVLDERRQAVLRRIRFTRPVIFFRLERGRYPRPHSGYLDVTRPDSDLTGEHRPKDGPALLLEDAHRARTRTHPLAQSACSFRP